MEHCSYELSVQLRDAGFPQPTFVSGQVWWRTRIHSGKNVACLFLTTGAGVLDFLWVPLDGLGDPDFGRRDYVYAPTALDILEELPKMFALTRLDNDKWGVVHGLMVLLEGDEACTILSEQWKNLKSKKLL